MNKSITFTNQFFLLSLFITIAVTNNFAQIPTNGLVAYYPFNGNANDFSGNNNNGQLYGGLVLTEDRFGNSNSAYLFDGVNDYIVCPTNNFPIGGTARSISVWIKSPNMAVGNKMLLGWGSPTNFKMSALAMGRGNLPSRKLMYWGWGDDFDTQMQLQDNVWYHIVYTYENNLGKLYVNGSLDNSANLYPNTPSGTSFYIGDFTTVCNNFNGIIDDIRIYNRTLSNSEVQDLYNEGGQTTSITYNLKRHPSNVQFNLNQDSWNFGNFDYEMWPPSWYDRFDYSGIDPFTNNNYPSYFTEAPILAVDRNFPDWPLFVTTFGTSQCYLGPPQLGIYRPTALLFWTALKNILKEQTWDGSCGGFAISTFMDFDDHNKFAQQYPPIGINYNTLYSLNNDDDIRLILNKLWLHQFGLNELVYFTAKYNFTTPNQTVQEIINMFNTTGIKNRYLILSQEYFKFTSHTVNPYRVILSSSGIDSIFVYDNNYPGNNNRVILVDRNTNKWHYFEQEGNYNTEREKGLFLALDSDAYYTRPSMPTRIQSIVPYDKEYNSFVDSTIFIFKTGECAIQIMNENGDYIEFSDSSVTSTLNNSSPLRLFTKTHNPPFGFQIPKDNYKIDLSNFTDSLLSVHFVLDSIIYGYSRGDAESNQNEILYLYNGISVSSGDVDQKSIELDCIIPNEENEKVIKIQNLELFSDSIKFNYSSDSTVYLSNPSTLKNYKLELKNFSNQNTQIFTSELIPLGENTAHYIKVNWENIISDSILIYIDLGNNGTIDDSIKIVNQTTELYDQTDILPNEYRLNQNYPNPFNPSTTISWQSPVSGQQTLKVYDVLGNEVATLVDEYKSAGMYNVQFTMNNLSSGVYFYQLRAGDFIQTKKMILMK